MGNISSTYTTASISLTFPCEWTLEQKRDSAIFSNKAGVTIEIVCVHKAEKITRDDYVYFARSLLLKKSPPVDCKLEGFDMHRYDYKERDNFCVALIFGIEEVIFRFIVRMTDARQVEGVNEYVRPLLENLRLFPDRVERRKKWPGKS